MTEFIPYEKFATVSELKELVELLEANNIPYELEDDVQVFDASFANIQHHRDYRIKLVPSDFDRATALRNEVVLSEIDEIGSDYYLFDFTDDELIDLIAKQDEWSPFDFQLAQKILKDRGKELSTQTIEELKNERIKTLSEPEKDHGTWIVIGYVFAFLFGFMGIITGLYILSNKKTLPNGARIHSFSASDRSHGLIILILSGILFALTIAIRLMSSYHFFSFL